MSFLTRYARWLHTQWPAGGVEKIPVADEHGRTNVPGVYVVGDLRGIPLLKFSSDGGARAVEHILRDRDFQESCKSADDHIRDLVIVGAGVSGMAAALAARKAGLNYEVIESTGPFSTIVNFPKAKPIYTYPKDMTPAGDLLITADVKETLVDELVRQTLEQGIEPAEGDVDRVRRKGHLLEVTLTGGEPRLARRVIVAIGRSGNFRKLGVPGEEGLDKVYNRLHDPKDFSDRKTLVVGGGDSALETAIALAGCGGQVTLSYRGAEFARPKPENIEGVMALASGATADVTVEEATGERVTTAAPPGERGRSGSITLEMETTVKEIREKDVILQGRAGTTKTIANDVVFTMLGREAPLDFLRRSGMKIAGEWSKRTVAGFAAFVIFCVALYNWKSGGALANLFYRNHWWPTSLATTFAGAAANPRTFVGTLVISATGPAFWYTLAYSIIVVLFGVKRMRRRRTPYVRAQTLTLMAIQVLPLFLLPEIILPWLHHNGIFWKTASDALFPIVNYGHGREFWRAYGFILAWPLNVYNVFTDEPLGWWLVIAFAQTFVVIPLMVYLWGKGAYCGWICSCGALAETLGDTQRHKMVHGPRWNRVNMFGQVILAIAFLILLVRLWGWIAPNPVADKIFSVSKDQYKWIVDVTLAGVVGYGFYFWFSGRVWCRFVCPLAALMHIYARFSRFRILADKKKCISCNVCTSVCHQGIDIMNFANKGMPMEDPECVRCSACVESCPTGVLTFGQVDRRGNVIKTDGLAASPVQLRER